MIDLPLPRDSLHPMGSRDPHAHDEAVAVDDVSFSTQVGAST